MEGIDYSTARPSISGLWSAGKRFACRYLAYLPNAKVLTVTELRALQRQGMGVVLNWEQGSGDMFDGFLRGQTHAREAYRQALSLGAPNTIPIYFSCDQDVTSNASMNAVRDYLAGAVTILGRNRVGVYGEYDVIERMVGDVCDWGWQTYAWSGGKVSGKAHILQYRNGVTVAGGDCDLNRSLKDNFGAWFTNVRSGEVAGFARDKDGQLYYVNGMESRKITDAQVPDIVYTAGQGLSPAIAHGPSGGDAEWEKGGVVRKGWGEAWAGPVRVDAPVSPPVVTDAQVINAIRTVLKEGVDNAG